MARRLGVLFGGGVAAAVLIALPAQATESGASVYLLGTGGPEAAVLPPIEGVFLQNTVYYYGGESGGGKQFPIGGGVVAGLDASIFADFATVLWVPSTSFAGGTLALGAALPLGQVDVDVSAVVTGPRGNSVTLSTSDDAFIVGDPLLTGVMSWKAGKTSVALSALVNIPIGDYREDQLANLAFHRWATDLSLAVTWHDDASGWDVSGKTGFTFNGENEYTNYDSGNEWHVEASVEKRLSPAWTAGVQAYFLHQLTADSGAGATLGAFKGEVAGLGAQASYSFKIAGKIPATLRLHAFHEFDVTNRPEGDSVFLDFTMPLWVKMPPGAKP